MTMEQLLLNKLNQIGVDFIGIFIDLLSGKLFVSIEIFHDLFNLGIFLLERLSMTFTANGKNKTFVVSLLLCVQ